MAQKLTAEDLLSLEEYHKRRPEFRQRLMVEKKRRRLEIGPHAHLCFENKTTMHYQVQEMLRADRIFEQEVIAQELAAYNPLIPDGDNFKASMMLQYIDAHVRRAALAELVGIENHIWIKIAGHDAVYAIADEGMEPATDGKTSAVHFLRFQLDREQVDAVKSGATLAAGIDHARYHGCVDPVPEELAAALRCDLD